MGVAISNTEASNVLNVRFGAGTYLAPVGHTTSLHTGDPGPTDTPANEASGGGYARQTTTFGTSSGGNAIPSTNTITFPNMNAGTYTWFQVHATGTGARPQTRAALPASGVTLLQGQSLTIAAGALTCGLT